MTEPTTEAGRRHRAEDISRIGWNITDKEAAEITEDIHDIEAEARADIQDACQAAGLPRDAALWMLMEIIAKREHDILASRIGPYLDHRVGCPGHHQPLASDTCTCGLVELLAIIREEAAQ